MKGKKTGGKNWPKGVSGNPAGRPYLALEVKEFRKASQNDVVEEFKYLWSLPFANVKSVADSESQPVMRKFIAQALVKASETGDFTYINPILDRVHGKIPAQIKGEFDHKLNFHKELVNFIHGIEGETNAEENGEDSSKEDDEENFN